MDLGWKVLLPLALFNIALTAVLNVLIPNIYLSGGIAFVVGLVTIVAVATLAGPRKPQNTVTLVKSAPKIAKT
jgi:NADH-quinone oxidoreductase subunit H